MGRLAQLQRQYRRDRYRAQLFGGDDAAEEVDAEYAVDPPELEDGDLVVALVPVWHPNPMTESTTTTTTPPEPIMQFFGFEHLPRDLQSVSKPFAELAATIVTTLPRNAERTVALRKLLEAKDAAVRASIAK